MKFGLPVSIILHSAVIGATMLSLGGSKRMDDQVSYIPVEIVNISDLTVMPERPKPQPKPEPEQAPETSPDEPDDSEDVLATDNAPSDPRDDTIAPDESQPEDKPEDKPKGFSLGDVLNNAKKTSENYDGEDQPTETEAERNARENAQNGEEMSTGYVEAVQRLVYDRWTIPAGAPDLENLVVELTVSLSPSGKVQNVELSPESARRARRDAYFKTASDRAINAVNAAAPFDFLPRAQYARWKTMTLTFYPKDATIDG